jgi:hypothetical protein
MPCRSSFSRSINTMVPLSTPEVISGMGSVMQTSLAYFQLLPGVASVTFDYCRQSGNRAAANAASQRRSRYISLHRV